MTDTRIVLVKPGDMLIIGNVGALPDGQLEQGMTSLGGIKDALGLAGLVIFEGDIDLAAVAQASQPAESSSREGGTHDDPHRLVG